MIDEGLKRMIEPELLAFLESFDAYRTLGADEKAAIAGSLVTARHAKDSILLAQGQVPDACHFVLRGCVRQYSVSDDGVERTVEFYCEGQSAVAYSGYRQRRPSEYFLSCVEDTLTIVGSASTERSMYDAFPVLADISRAMLESDVGELQDKHARFKATSPEERYEWLVETRGDLVSRVPQYLLADYLGMAPETLSRVRKRRALSRASRR